MKENVHVGHFNIGDEPTFGRAQDDLPFDELRAVCGPYNCSQVILAEQHEALGLTVEQARRLGLVLGGGMWHGSTCGCLMAAIAAAGFLEFPELQPVLVEKFAEEAGALSCPAIVHSPTSCAKCIALGRELVAELVKEAASRGEDLTEALEMAAADDSGAPSPQSQDARVEFAVSRYTGAERAVIIPEGVTEVLPHVFEGLPMLCNVLFPASMRVIGERAFANCTNLRNVVFKDGLREIGEHAFEGCTALTAVELPSTVERIGKDAFKGCVNVRKGNLDLFQMGEEEG